MSTFNGITKEFPDIRIDFFRKLPGSRPPLACFLSHVHSDHLAGLESLRSPFVYCSAATREILLRLERYPCRINYAKGFLEARQQTYKHLKNILKPLPLGTPASLELQPGQVIQVTLLDSNHCPGSVMFLIEGDGKSILYTGDTRSEPWLVNNLARNPVCVEYTSGLKTFDTIYIDTSFTDNVPFQTKAEGLTELLSKVSKYPKDTIFHLQAWTYGYEDAWLALSKALGSKIHVDDYKMRIYNSLRVRSSDPRIQPDLCLVPEAASLIGFFCGNSPQAGCLTSDINVRLHSCEKGNLCSVARQPNVVTIQPIVAHLPDNVDLIEVGVGGGGDDLEKEVELEFLTPMETAALFSLVSSTGEMDESSRITLQNMLHDAANSGRPLGLNLDISSFNSNLSADLQTAFQSVLKARQSHPSLTKSDETACPERLPKVIQFPYARHSSYPELCLLVELFKPRDVWPCTVNVKEWLKSSITIKDLFGRFCSGDTFRHDLEMAEPARKEVYDKIRRAAQTSPGPSPPSSHRLEESSPVYLSEGHPSSQPVSSKTVSEAKPLEIGDRNHATKRGFSDMGETARPSQTKAVMEVVSTESGSGSSYHDASEGLPRKRGFEDYSQKDLGTDDERTDSQRTDRSFASTLSIRHSAVRSDAYYRMLKNATGDTDSFSPLISVDDGHSTLDQDLGG